MSAPYGCSRQSRNLTRTAWSWFREFVELRAQLLLRRCHFRGRLGHVPKKGRLHHSNGCGAMPIRAVKAVWTAFIMVFFFLGSSESSIQRKSVLHGVLPARVGHVLE